MQAWTHFWGSEFSTIPSQALGILGREGFGGTFPVIRVTRIDE